MRRAYPLTLLSLLAAVFALNATVDLAGTRGGGEIESLATRQRRDDILVSEVELDQRAWLRGRLHAACPDVLIAGSSTIGGLTEAMLGNGSTLNAWLTGPTIEDYEATLTLLGDVRCVPKQIVIGVDPWLLDRTQRNERWRTLYWELVRYRGARVGARELAGPAVLAWATLKERLSFVSTLESARWALQRARAAKPATSPAPHLVAPPVERACAAAASELRVRFADGHFIGCPQFALDAAGVENVANAYTRGDPHGVVACEELDDELLTRLREIVRRHRARGSRVVLLTPPYHPLTYQALDAVPAVHARLAALDRALAELAPGADFLALRDPARAGCEATEFNDSHHARPSCLEKVARVVTGAAALRP